MKYRKISEIIFDPISGEWGDEGEGVKVLRTTNFTNEGRLDLSEVVSRDIDHKKILKKKLRVGDAIIEKSGGSPSQPVGRVVYFDQEGEDYLCNNFTSVLRLNDDSFDSRYFFWNLFFQHLAKKTLRFQNKTTGIINLQLQRYINETEIRDIPLPTQLHIASILDKADALRQQNRQLLEHYDALLQSTFIEMFGNLLSKKKELIRLETISSVQGGLQVSALGRKNLPLKLPYLRVANVYRNQLDLTEVKSIELTEGELRRSKLEKGDLLIVEGHGNKNEIGRAAIWDGSISPIVHQNHLIRVRPEVEFITPIYLCYFINSQQGRTQLVESSNTTSGLNTISTGKVKNILLSIPKVSLQQHFAQIVTEIEAQKAAARVALAESEQLFQSLLTSYFGDN